MTERILSVCGCALADHLYNGLDFQSDSIRPFLSRENGDGGIAPGKLVFAEDLQSFAGMDFATILERITSGVQCTAENVGGPGIVGAINASQILYNHPVKVEFYGARGDDESGEYLSSVIEGTDVGTVHYKTVSGATPCTFVLSDPDCNDGKGERSFLNRIGAAECVTPDFLGEDFFRGDVLWFAATALVPNLHDNLGALLRKGRAMGKLNIVSTVYDFRNEKKAPCAPWPLGDPDSWHDIDLLIVDKEEALRLSGSSDLPAATRFFRNSGVSSFFITCGAKSFLAWSDGKLFRASGRVYELPVSALADKDLAEHPERRGDTTGCGDNFAGGIVASLFLQFDSGLEVGDFSLIEAAAWGAASGGAACFQIGGVRRETHRGEKYMELARYAESYAKETAKFKI